MIQVKWNDQTSVFYSTDKVKETNYARGLSLYGTESTHSDTLFVFFIHTLTFNPKDWPSTVKFIVF